MDRLHRTLRPVWALCAVVFVVAAVVGGIIGIGESRAQYFVPDRSTCPPGPELADWNAGDTKKKNNCYHYAANTKRMTFGSWPGGQPGGGVADPVNAADVIGKATADGLILVSTASGCTSHVCTQGCLVALVVAGSQSVTYTYTARKGTAVVPLPTRVKTQSDFHWYRRNDDGSWSHKPGSTCARTTDAAGAEITDPAKADRSFNGSNKIKRPSGWEIECVSEGPGYTEFAGCFCVPKGGTTIRAADGPVSAPPIDAHEIAISIVMNAGLPDPGWSIFDGDADLLVFDYLQNIVPVTDPGWDENAMGLQGFGLEFGIDVAGGGAPKYIRVRDDVIEFSDASGVTEFFEDTNYLGDYLVKDACGQGLVPCPPQTGGPTGACCLPDKSCLELAEGLCDAAEGRFQGEGSLCSEVECAAIPTVSEWGLIVTTLLGMTVGTIIFGRRRRPAAA